MNGKRESLCKGSVRSENDWMDASVSEKGLNV